MIRRLRLFRAEFWVDYYTRHLLAHGQTHCGGVTSCSRWDQIAAHLDTAYDDLAKASR